MADLDSAAPPAPSPPDVAAPPMADGAATIPESIPAPDDPSLNSNVLPAVEAVDAEKIAREAQLQQMKDMPVRQYLETTVVPLLLEALQKLVIDRPYDPVEYLGSYLLLNNPQKLAVSVPSTIVEAVPEPNIIIDNIDPVPVSEEPTTAVA